MRLYALKCQYTVGTSTSDVGSSGRVKVLGVVDWVRRDGGRASDGVVRINIDCRDCGVSGGECGAKRGG